MNSKKLILVVLVVVVGLAVSKNSLYEFYISINNDKSSLINKPDPTKNQSRVFKTSFESLDDFKGFYISPQNHQNSASHDFSTEQAKSGKYSHKGWIYKTNNPSTVFTNNNHRGYPTVQFNKTEGGAFKTPVLIEFWVWLDMEIAKGEWFSFATLDHTNSTEWDAVLVNLSDVGTVQLMHVPSNGKGTRTFQTTNIKFPMKKWVKLTICLNFDAEKGGAKVWQDDQLVSEANISKGRGDGFFTQAHFGLYAPPSISKGVVYNDDLIIKEGNCKS
ncbi:MAG: polysaccharide lyase [bacterium]|nr:polysaccharide lyase [bacterium]